MTMPQNQHSAKVIPFDAARWNVTQNPQAIAEKGEAIYREKYQRDYEQRFLGKYVAIDITTGDAWIADSPEKALELAQTKNPNGFFHLIRVGSAGVYRVGYTQSQARDWFY